MGRSLKTYKRPEDTHKKTVSSVYSVVGKMLPQANRKQEYFLPDGISGNKTNFTVETGDVVSLMYRSSKKY